MKQFVIIVAGGSGARMNSNLPKQFMLLQGKPVLYYSIKTFLEALPDAQIILVLPEPNIDAGREIIDAYFGYSRISIIVGGRTRFHSVQAGLSQVSGDDAVIFVHDAVRPFVDRGLIERCIVAVEQTGSAIPVVPSKDSVRLITEDGNEGIERERVRLVQTPQAFHGKILLPAFFGIDYKDWYTDEATVIEAFGMKPTLVEGDPRNIKITYPADIALAEFFLSNP